MNWINGFELMCYVLSAVLIWDMLRKQNIDELKLFLSGAIAGYTLELLAVRVTDIYYYNPSFWLNLGRMPYQFPVFGGLMWGGLTVCALRIAKRLGFGRVMTAVVTGFLIVSMDMLLDVAAIRLDGGFWTWEGRDINLTVDHHMFMSVIWVNFLGYMFETPMVTFMSLRGSSKSRSRPWYLHAAEAVVNALAGIAFAGVLSLLSLWLNSVTDEWFAFIAYILVWAYTAVRILLRTAEKLKQGFDGKAEMLAWVFFAAMYLYCFAGLGALGILAEKPLYLIFGIVLFAGTMLTAFYGKKEA